MNQEYFQKWTDMAKSIQKPLQALIELNMKSLQNLSYIKPEEFASIKKPEQLLEKQMTIVIENGHKALDYMKKSFEIVESSLLSMNDYAKNSMTDPASFMEKMTGSMENSASSGWDMAKSAMNTNPFMGKAGTVMEKPASLKPETYAKEMMKPLVDHQITAQDTNEKIVKEAQSATRKMQGFDGKKSKKQNNDDKSIRK